MCYVPCRRAQYQVDSRKTRYSAQATHIEFPLTYAEGPKNILRPACTELTSLPSESNSVCLHTTSR
jgi:hypothetical protein